MDIDRQCPDIDAWTLRTPSHSVNVQQTLPLPLWTLNFNVQPLNQLTRNSMNFLTAAPSMSSTPSLDIENHRYYHPVTNHGRAASLARIDSWIDKTLANVALAYEPVLNGTPTPQQKKALTTHLRILSRLRQEREYLLARPPTQTSTTA